MPTRACAFEKGYVTTLDATLEYSSSTATPVRRQILFLFFSPSFPLHWFQNVTSYLLNACFMRKQNKVTQNKSPPSRPHKKETKYAEKQNVCFFCTVGSVCPLLSPHTHTHTHTPPSHCPDAGRLLCTRAASAADEAAAKAWWGPTGAWGGGGGRLLLQGSCSPQWVAG